MKNFKKQKGITLIALIVTIIVLLILAGITIVILAGNNGILNKAADAKTMQNKAQIIEEAKLDILAQITENTGRNITETQLRNILKKYFDADEVDSLELGYDLATVGYKITSLDGNYKINLADIYSGSVEGRAAGLYNVSTGALIKSWEELIEDDVIRVNNGVLSTGMNSNRYTILSGQLIMPRGIREISNSTFMMCTGLVGNLIIPNTITTIGDGAFYYCSNLTGDLIIPNSVTSLGNSAFNGCSGFSGDLIIGSGVNKVTSETFKDCTGITGSLIIKGSVANLSGIPFGNLNISKVIMPYQASLGIGIFNGSVNITEVVISKDLTNIPPINFLSCTNLNKVYYTGTEEEWNAIIIDGGNDPLLNAEIIYNYVPDI